MAKPKFELRCVKEDNSIYFVIKNVSSSIISNMTLQSFVLKEGNGDTENILLYNNSFPTSLGQNEEYQFKYDHKYLRQRPIGAKSFYAVFTLEDENDNAFQCELSKDVSNCNDTDCALGKWETAVSMIDEQRNEDAQTVKTKIFISHRSKDVEYAAAMVDFLEDLGVSSRYIVCTSVPDHLIPNGKRIYEWLREQFTNYDLHMLFLLSDNYYESPDCLNEMGAAWVTKADSDIILLPGFSPDKIRGCIGQDMMAVYCDGDDEILMDRIKQLRDKVCGEFELNKPDDRRWGRIRDALLKKLQKKEEIQRTETATQNQIPEFEIRILETNKQVPGTAEPIDGTGNRLSSHHKNVLFAIELKNDVMVENLKVFGRSIDSVVQKNQPYHISVCYMESPDTLLRGTVYTLSRDIYPAGADGIPKIVIIEYSRNDVNYRQKFVLEGNHTYASYPEEKVIRPDMEKIIQMKNEMKKDFLRNPEELNVSSYEISQRPVLKYIYRDVIIMSKDCQDQKWNTDGGFGRYEIYDFCDEGLLLWDYSCQQVEVEYFLRASLSKTDARQLLCLKYEDIITYDMEGNSGYNIPIIYTKYELGENPFQKYYYLDEKGYGIISNSVITEVKDKTER
ncbi:toll/interleukin-1 receptor domain-containing protein [Aristaeella hokkaidonensis]|uniref:Toll/interleukin-1 receptor domain-containing protein n=1 Tax=Aristaeella hokkaidonensis TaxID=3046382 RepID=A0AC61MW50_9FIRM|nr:toll/interleukin-1 receptor domain-containing protein [Aristaeella hokkaidonensis]QUC66924.1 toll/interleukin-1 receptor domain-containing protein [Aristaeella hokkaidonensis]SNT94444.1 TIR domain-containing protein [Aristaeella hokkaidonensis]